MRVGIAVALGLALSACRERALEIVRFDASFPVTPPRAEEPRQVHFTFSGPEEVTFSWLGSAATLRFWSKDIPPRTVQARTPSPRPFSSTGPWHEAVADALVPGVEYRYEVGHPLRPEPLAFRAPPSRGTSGFSFVAVGDFGSSGNSTAVAIVHRLIRIADPAFVLGLGDMTYGDLRSQAAVDRHFDDVMAWSRRAAYMPVWGNHEWERGGTTDGDDLRNYKGRFALPNAVASPGAPAAGCCGEDWYWFDYGTVRFIVYPEPYAPETWRDWQAKAEPLFAEAESDPAIAFVVTAGHRAAYSSGRHGSELALRAILDGFGKRFGKYVLSLNGHNHVYERTKPQHHVTHVTAGIGGMSLERADTECLWTDCKPPAFTAFRALRHGMLKVNVRPGVLALEAICGPASPGNNDLRCAEGEILDQVLIPAGGEVSAEGRRGGKRQTAAIR